MQRLSALCRKEFIQFFRDYFVVLMVIYIFTLDIYLAANTINFEVEDLSVAVYDLEKSPQSRRLLEAFNNTEYFHIKYYLNNQKEIDKLIVSGDADIGIIIPSLFSRKIENGGTAKVQLLVDGTNPNLGLVALGYAVETVDGYSKKIELERFSLTPGNIGAKVENRILSLYNPNLDSLQFITVAAMLQDVMFVAMLLAAAAIVREKESGTMEQLLVTPVRPLELMIAKMAPAAVISIIGITLSLIIMITIMGLSLEINFLLFFCLSIPFLTASYGIGIFISTVARNLQQALLTIFLIFYPIGFLSGTYSPRELLPEFFQYVAYLSPLTYYNTISYGIFFKGVGLSVLWPHVLALIGFSAIIFYFSIRRFRKLISFDS